MSPASRLDALLCMHVRPGRHLYQHVNVSGGGEGEGGYEMCTAHCPVALMQSTPLK